MRKILLFAITSVLATSITPAMAVTPSLTLRSNSQDLVTGTSATITPGGSIGIAGPDWSKFSYSITVPTGKAVTLQISYRTKLEDVCLGTTTLTSGSYRFCSFEQKSNNFSLRAGSLGSSSEVLNSTLTITVVEDVSTELLVRAWVDSDLDKRIDGFEPYSSNLVLRNYSSAQLPLLLDVQFDPPVWGQPFSASIGSKRSPERRIFSDGLLDLSKFHLEAKQSDDQPFVEPASLSQPVIETFNAQPAYFENRGTGNLQVGVTTVMSIGLFDTANRGINTSLNGTYVTAQLQVFDYEKGTYGTVTGAPFDNLESNVDGLVTVNITPSVSLIGVGRVVMRYMSFDNVQIATNSIPVTFTQPRTDDQNPNWRRVILSSGVAESHQSTYELNLYYRPLAGKKVLVATAKFDYRGFNVGEVETGVSAGAGQLFPVTQERNVADQNAQLYELIPTARRFKYELRAKDVNGKPGENWPVYLRLNLQDIGISQIAIDGIVMDTKEELVIHRRTNSDGLVTLDLAIPNNYAVKPLESIKIEPQIFGMKDNLLPRLERYLTVVSWQEDRTTYLSGDWSAEAANGNSLPLKLTVTNRLGKAQQVPVIVTAEAPLSFYTSSLTTDANGQLLISADLSTMAFGKGKSHVYASILVGDEIKQLVWEVSWEAANAKLSAQLKPHTNGKPQTTVQKLLENQLVQFDLYRQSTASDYILKISSLQKCPAGTPLAKALVAVEGAKLTGTLPTAFSPSQDLVIGLKEVDLRKLRVYGNLGSCLVTRNAIFEYLGTETGTEVNSSGQAVNISSANSQIRVQLTNQRGNEVSILISGKWYRYTPTSNNATWSVTLTPGRTVQVSVYVNKVLQTTQTITVAPSNSSVAGGPPKTKAAIKLLLQQIQPGG